jgi:hypothetical protein
MNWLRRFADTPWYFKVFAMILVADALLSWSFLVPALYDLGFSHLGNVWWMALLVFCFLFPREPRAARRIALFAAAMAVIATIQTVMIYRVALSAHAEFPSHPSFYFRWFHWADGVVLPWAVAAFFGAVPAGALPLRPPANPA